MTTQVSLTYTTTNRFYRCYVNGKKSSVSDLEKALGLPVPRYFSYPELGSLKLALGGSGFSVEYDNDFDCF